MTLQMCLLLLFLAVLTAATSHDDAWKNFMVLNFKYLIGSKSKE